MGLIMSLAGLTMVMRSQSDQISGSAQSTAVAEAGITEVLSTINLVRFIADEDLEKWKDAYTRNSGTRDTSCTSTEITTRITQYDEMATDEKTWIYINGDTDRYRIESYNYNGDSGELVVKGQADFEKDRGTSVLRVSIPVDPISSSKHNAGLRSNKVALGNNTIDGDLLVQGCESDESYSANEQNGQNGGVTGSVTYDPLAGLPSLPSLPEDVIDNFDNKEKAIEGIDIGSITSTDYQFPKELKYKDSNGRYHYIVDSISLQGSGGGGSDKVLEVSDKTTIYLRGDIDIKGNRSIENTTGDASNLKIYGGDGEKEGVYNKGITKKVCISGNSQIENAFILAPEASAGVRGGGNAQPNFRGRLWVKNWGIKDSSGDQKCGSDANQTTIEQAGSLDSLPDSITPKKIGPIQSWRRIPNDG